MSALYSGEQPQDHETAGNLSFGERPNEPWSRCKPRVRVWTAVILHASHNLFIQQIFDPLTPWGGVTKYVTTEFGAGLALGYTALAIYFWHRRGDVQVAAAGFGRLP